MRASVDVRRPRYQLLLDGTALDGCETLEFSSNNLGQAGSFFARIACGADDQALASLSSVTTDTELAIRMGFLASGMQEGDVSWQEMMSGRIDRVRLDPVAGIVTLEGRDHTARLLDYPLTEGFLNSTSSDVASILAQRCSLSCNADNTVALIGQYYQIDHARVSLARFSRYGTAWDLLCSLAQLESFEVWVHGSTLNFSRVSDSPAQIRSLVFVPPSPGAASPTLNASALSLDRVVAMVGGRTTEVSSWNSRQRMRISARSSSQAGGTGPALKLIRPNLLQSSAQSLADGIDLQLSGHAQTISVRTPGDLTLAPRDTIRLSGVGNGWDGDYRIDQIDREIDLHSGFSQRVVARTING